MRNCSTDFLAYFVLCVLHLVILLSVESSDDATVNSRSATETGSIGQNVADVYIDDELHIDMDDDMDHPQSHGERGKDRTSINYYFGI